MYSSLALGEVKQPKNSVDTTRKLSEPGMVGQISEVLLSGPGGVHDCMCFSTAGRDGGEVGTKGERCVASEWRFWRQLSSEGSDMTA